MRRIVIAAATAAAFLSVVASAQASGYIAGSCESVVFTITPWPQPANAHMTVYVDGATRYDETRLITEPVTFGFDLNLQDGQNHVVTAVFDWPEYEEGTKRFGEAFTCAAPAPPAVSSTPPVVAPGGSPPASSTQGQGLPVVAPAAPTSRPLPALGRTLPARAKRRKAKRCRTVRCRTTARAQPRNVG